MDQVGVDGNVFLSLRESAKKEQLPVHIHICEGLSLGDGGGSCDDADIDAFEAVFAKAFHNVTFYGNHVREQFFGLVEAVHVEVRNQNAACAEESGNHDVHDADGAHSDDQSIGPDRSAEEFLAVVDTAEGLDQCGLLIADLFIEQDDISLPDRFCGNLHVFLKPAVHSHAE